MCVCLGMCVWVSVYLCVCFCKFGHLLSCLRNKISIPIASNLVFSPAENAKKCWHLTKKSVASATLFVVMTEFILLVDMPSQF